MRRVNLYEAELNVDDDPPGYDALPYLKIGPAVGAERMAGTYVEMPPGRAVCPYHYELGEEEWLIVLEGRPSVRHPGGTERVDPGDVVCFVAGPDGAHQIFNEGKETVRAVIVSTRVMPAVAVYPESNKVGVFSETDPKKLMFRQSDAVDYYEGEPDFNPPDR